jgi:pimeloyl-ACP methyl ester carboxylesterase
MARITARRHRRHAGRLAACAAVGGGALAAAAGPSPAAADSHLSTLAAPARAVAPHARQSMVAADGHRLEFYITPGHLPAIVLNAGGGLDLSVWAKVAPELARGTGSEIITYDRSGEGKSPEVAGPFTAQGAAAELHAGLEKLGVNGDVVLVSHSLAGEIAVHFVRSYPGEVAGAVLVDASLPQFYTRRETARIVAATKPVIAHLKREPLTKSSRQLIALSHHYGPIHLAYHKLTWPKTTPAIVLESSTTPHTAALDARRWRAAQREFAHAARNRRLVVAPDSTHDIPDSRPSAVIRQVKKMVHVLGRPSRPTMRTERNLRLES